MADQSNTERLNGPMAEMFRYNGWANLRLIEACRGLTEAQLDVRIPGTYGAIRDTLVHLVNSQQAFLGRLDGVEQEVGVKPFEAWPGFDDLAREAARSSDRLVAVAESTVEDANVDLSHLGKTFRFPKSFFLAHAIEHASEHRTQVAVTLAHLGVDTPDLDGWAYARKARHGTVV